MKSEIITFNKVSLKISEINVLENLSFSINPGEFAYLIGKNLGKQKLFPSISPKKTVEGFLGGLFFACISSYFIAKYTNTLEFTQWLILAIIVSVFGTLGDLIESKYKRQAGVKDSGVIMPGHGGLLDRLDSIIFAAPFIYLFLRLTEYVS